MAEAARLAAHPAGIDQAAGLRRLLAPRVATVATVLAGRAGDGGTAVAANLAAALARDGVNAQHAARGVEAGALADLLLIDTESAAAATASELVLVATPDAASITAAYARCKRLAASGEKRFALVINRARDAAHGAAIAARLADTAARFLDARVDFLGAVPIDRRIADAARLGRAVVETFPDAPSARAWCELADAWRARRTQD